MSNFLETQFDLTDKNLISVIDDVPFWSAPFGLALLDAVKFKKNINALDIGSGLGFPLIELSQRFGNTCKFYGIDPWKEAVERTNLKIKTWNLSNVKMIEGVAEELPFDNDYFDLIISNNGINNVEDDSKVLSEISRTAKRGAQLLITVNLPGSMIEFYDVYKQVLNEEGKEDLIKKLDEHIYSKRKPLSYTKKLIEKNGFGINNVYEDSFKFRYSDGSAMLNHFLIKLAFLDSWKDILPEEQIITIFNSIENKLNKISGDRGEFNLTIPFVCIDGEKL